ncbi:hypothetical protein N0B31_16860 [Salinirubellus salinus]|uniref:DUF8159 domain-containing protein n=1 Tax=Salinirubellus salinus TaxID=1364945 RepID=A0A9E7UA32_9EURY|nr:hypothetical protein [Salinirubellus salinus]UWM53793.1 hypothetical protein N0B31_16860 [Salinirubellus salinus]
MSVSDDELAERLEERLMSHGVYVVDYTESEGALHVAYETATKGEGVAKSEIGRLLNVLLDAREDGWEPRDVNAWVYDIEDGPVSDRDPKGRWEAREGWLYALEEGYLSETDFSTLVLSTVRT